MLPAPARIAAAPTAKSRPSCRPAVPPPPVTGAALGTRLVEEVAGAVAMVPVAVVRSGAGELEVTPGVLPPEVAVLVPVLLPLLPRVLLPEEGVPPEDAGAVAEPVAVGELVTDAVNVGTLGVEGLEVHAETATGTIRASAPQQRAVSLTPSAVLAVVPRTSMDPPRAPGR